MPNDPRSQERGAPLSREDWITKFVSAMVHQIRLGLDRMIAVAAARDEWQRMQGTNPHAAAKEWAQKSAADQ